MSAKVKNDMTFEEAFHKLEAIVEQMESGETTLDSSLQAFEEGMQLIQTCTAMLEEAKIRIQQLTQDDTGRFHLKPLEE